MPMTNRFSSLKKLAEFLKHREIATIQELKDVVGTDVSMTIYRMLKRLSYRTSYSHNGRYYALNKTLKFNQQGLWTTRSVWFSRSLSDLEPAEYAYSQYIDYQMR